MAPPALSLCGYVPAAQTHLHARTAATSGAVAAVPPANKHSSRRNRRLSRECRLFLGTCARVCDGRMHHLMLQALHTLHTSQPCPGASPLCNEGCIPQNPAACITCADGSVIHRLSICFQPTLHFSRHSSLTVTLTTHIMHLPIVPRRGCSMLQGTNNSMAL